MENETEKKEEANPEYITKAEFDALNKKLDEKFEELIKAKQQGRFAIAPQSKKINLKDLYGDMIPDAAAMVSDEELERVFGKAVISELAEND